MAAQCLTNYIWLEALSNYHCVDGLDDGILRHYIDAGYWLLITFKIVIPPHESITIDSQFFVVGNIDFRYAKKMKKMCLVVFNYWWADLWEVRSTGVCYGHIVHCACHKVYLCK